MHYPKDDWWMKSLVSDQLLSVEKLTTRLLGGSSLVRMRDVSGGSRTDGTCQGTGYSACYLK